MNLQSLMSFVTLLVSLFMPKLIAYVATSNRRWVNFLISYGTSALLGVVTSLASKQFTSDIWMNLTIAITATQAAYNTFWKAKLTTQ